MSFLHTSIALGFIGLAAVPILLHLLTLHRLKTVELSTFRFLFDSYVQQRRRMQFLEALLAILRTLFIVFLVGLFARPVVKHWDRLFGSGGGSGGRDVVLLMDCSASMNARTSGTAAFDRAKEAALSVVERLDQSDRVTLIRVGSRPEELFNRFTTDAKGIREQIEGLKTTFSRANLFNTLLHLFGPNATKRTNPLVYLFTDCQSSGWKEVRNQGIDRLIPTGTPFYVVNVGSTEAVANVAVVGDAPRRNRTIAGLPFTLQARAVNFSKTEKSDVTLNFYLDEKEVARMPLSLKPGETVVRKYTHTPKEPGIQKGRFEISSRQPDRFPDDDRFLYTLSVVPRIKTVLVNGNKSADPFEDEARYLLTALTTSPDDPDEKKAAGLPESSKEFLRSLDVKEIVENQLTAETLKDASVVILANCGALNVNQFTWLREFVNAGGGLLILPGDKVSPQIYNTQFFPVPGPQGETLTSATLLPAEGDPEKAETFEELAAFDFAHPALTVFDNPDPDARHFKTVRVYKRYKIQMPQKKGNAWPLVQFAKAGPALVESRLGDGIVILAGFPFHTRWTNLPTKPDFVPLVLRLASHVEHRPDVEVPPVVTADGAAEIAVTGSWAPAEATVKLPSGATLPVPMERSGPRLLGAFDKTAERGYYMVDVKSGSTLQGKAATLAFAVNLAPEESEFILLGEPQLRELLPNTELTFIDATAESQQVKGPIGNEHEIFDILIWVVFAIIAAEFLLATTSGRKRELEEATVAERIMNMTPGSWVGRMTGGGVKQE